jgi:hypothetical protein
MKTSWFAVVMLVAAVGATLSFVGDRSVLTAGMAASVWIAAGFTTWRALSDRNT